MDDIFRRNVGRSRLCPEHSGDRRRRKVSALDLKILMNEIQQVQLLPLILMQALGLNGKDRIRIQLNPLLFVQPIGELLLIVSLDLHQLL